MSSKLISNKDYVAGWLDTSIHDFLEVLSSNTAGTEYALITCLDSNPNPASLRTISPELKPIQKKLQLVGNGLLLPTKLLLKTNSRSRIFFGFDEVCFFPHEPILPKPATASLVGPARIDQVRFNRLSQWLADTACTLALGGGEGLNFIARAQGLVQVLLGCSIEQSEPVSLSV